MFVLRTNTDLNPLAAMLRYKQLWTVEQTFRTAKHLLTTRPIFHKLDETIRGHVFCSFLALVIKAELEARIAAFARQASWSAIIADLDALTETEIEQDGKRFLLRSAPRPAASLALRAAGWPCRRPCRHSPQADRHHRECSAKPPPRRESPRLFNCLAKVAVEDGSESRMPETGASGSMSGDGKRSDAKWFKQPRPSSTLPRGALG